MSEDMLHHIIRWHVCFAVRRASAVAPRDLPGLSAVERREEVSGFGSLVLPLPQTRAAGVLLPKSGRAWVSVTTRRGDRDDPG
jgi:hypothetical protein